ncbi:MAG: methyltransferase domain-containing protein [Candidatus Eremiobacteraeota bacterium]|nr:methyltransferase domain-containing protein [Candidatus Eremiobacteraeota bacterium]
MGGIPDLKALEGAVFSSQTERLSALLERGLGLAPTATNVDAFLEQCRHRAAGLGIRDDAYFDLLEAGGPSARTEWMALSPVLTVGETFLFRDAALWRLVERTLLPELARLTRPLWLWSAGCSTGEEAYTLAIVARRALGANAFTVLGSDVNPKAVAAARVGVYTQWSLRGVDHDRLDDLITSGTQTVRVHDDVKAHVRFDTHNLNDPNAFPPAGMSSFECIICRNVLIYMTHGAREKVIERLASCLTPGGVLVLGHGEAQGIVTQGLVIERHDAGIVYRKPLQPTSIKERPSQPKATARKPAARPAHAPRTSKAVLKTRSAHKPAAPPVEAPIDAERARRLLDEAVLQARSGKADAAERIAASAMAANPLDPEPHVLLAALFAARDAFKQAEAALRRALFLDPACIPALWQMGTLYRLTNRDRQAAYTFARLLARLEGLPPDREALPFDNLTVNELTTLLRAALGEPADA